MRRFRPSLWVSSLRSVRGSEEHFEKRIRPLPLEHCIKCHTPSLPGAAVRSPTAPGAQSKKQIPRRHSGHYNPRGAKRHCLYARGKAKLMTGDGRIQRIGTPSKL
jgi:hypothetical protein